VSIYVVKNEIFATVTWKPRENNCSPQPSRLSVAEIRSHAPRLMISAFRHFLQEHKEKTILRQTQPVTIGAGVIKLDYAIGKQKHIKKAGLNSRPPVQK
jgi:hypothetical protein